MKCVMCQCTDISLLKLQTYIDYTTLKEIRFILPDFAVPDTNDPVYVCSPCQEQVSTFSNFKETTLKNLRQLNLYEDILKVTSDAKFNDFKIVSTKVNPDVELNINQNCNKLFSLKVEDQCKEKVSISSIVEEPKDQSVIEQKKYICPDCNKTFARSSNLEAHIRTHTGEKPFKCPTCQKSFNQCSNLNRHKVTHTGEKPHECDVCHKTFAQRSTLTYHKRNHTNVRPYKCSVCGNTFKQSDDLKRHISLHTGEKPHQCHLCQFRCTQGSSLKEHIRIHTGEKPYSCELCPKAFAQLCNLKQHRLRIHNVKV